MGKQISQLKIDKIVKLRKEGLTVKVISERLGVSEFTIFSYLRSFGLTQKKKGER